MTQFIISQLWIYPVKSIGGMRVKSADITASGSLVGDREWLVVDPQGKMLWQGDIPAMTLLSARLDGGQLVISALGGAELAVDRYHAGPAIAVSMYGYDFTGIDAGDQAAAHLSGALGSPCRLVRVGEQAHHWPGLNPVHVMSEHSLADLNRALAAKEHVTIEAERFRPNVLLTGSHEPYAEEAAAVIHFDGADIVLREPCVGCELPNISRVDASRQKQPLKLIGAMSKTRDTSKPASFGTYARAVGKTLRVGAQSMCISPRLPAAS